MTACDGRGVRRRADFPVKRNIRNHEAAQSLRAPVFFDRGIPECLAWLQLSGLALEPHHLAAPASGKLLDPVNPP